MSRSARYTSALRILILLIFLATIPGQAQTPASGVSVVPEPPIQWPRSHNYDMQHLTLKLAFDWQQEMVSGETTLRLRPMQNSLSEVELDAAELEIESIKLVTKDGKPTKELKYRIEPEKLFVALDREYQLTEDINFVVKYRAKPKQGLTFIKPNASDPNSPYQIWSQGESNTNHYWFPCYDYPNDRATTELIATVESKYRVISNGSLISTKTDEEKGQTTYHWRMEQPYSSYLVSIVVGEFAEIKRDANGTPVYHYVYKDREQEGRLTFANVPDMIKHYSEKLGHPYPYSKYSETVAHNFGGGMENITATTLTDSALKDARALYDSDDSLSAHEVAHQWFGNMITCRDWSDLWLNEGFASLMASVWIEHSRGPEENIRKRVEEHQNLTQRYQQGYRRPISTRRYFNPDDLFDENSYARAEMVLHMLREIMGEQDFWRSINHYLKTNRGRMVTTADLVTAISETTGQNYEWFFDQWVYKLGQPELEIESSYDDAAKIVKLRVKQVQKPDPQRPWFEVTPVYRLPVDIAITTAQGSKNYRVVIELADQEIVLPVDERPLFINFDRGNDILKIVRYNRPKPELLYQLRNDDDISGRWRAAAALKTFNDEAVITALAAALTEDKSPLVRQKAAETLGTIKAEAARIALKEAINDKDWRVRNRAIIELSQLKDANLLPLFQRVIENDPSLQNVNFALIAAGQTTAPAALELLLSQLEKPSWQQTITRAALEGLGYFRDQRLLEVGLKYAAVGQQKPVRSMALYLLGTNGRGNAQAIALINAALNDKSGTLPFYAIQALNEMGDQQALESLEHYLQSRELSADVRSLAEQAASRLRQKLKPADGKKHAAR